MLALVCLLALADPKPTRDDVVTTLKKATTFYRTRVAGHGGYVYYYSLDLRQRWGEGKADADTLFVQPPGTPTVGQAFLTAYLATGEREFLDAARAAGTALVYGQLQSGGWTQTIHFGPAKRLGKYRNGKGGGWNVSSLDDDQTQAALSFLIRLDAALKFKDESIHDAALYGLKALLAAQYANGGFPQVWLDPVEKKPIVRAKLPEGDWRTTPKIKEYWSRYTLNDGLPGSVARTLIEAHQTYKDDRYRAALARLGDFLILAQMPQPQPGWCQQYDFDMTPAWARKFEPPAVSGWESQDAMETLIRIARYTGEAKYLAPIPPALKYFTEKCLLKDGRVARFYELGTNRPLYMDKAYRPTYDDSEAPGHYGWKQSARFDRIRRVYDDAKAGRPEPATRPVSDARVKVILDALDSEGRWVSVYDGERLVGQPKFERGFRFLSSEVFSRNVTELSEWLR